MDKFFVTAIFVSVFFISCLAQGQDTSSIWLSIKPSTQLMWTPCFDTFECALFSVPFDWTQIQHSNSTMAIALIRVPSAFDASDPRYRGPILYNPGGPGASGVDALLNLGPSFQKIMGEEYDIVSFDPRGFHHSTPAIRPYVSTEEDVSFAIRIEDTPPLDAAPDALARTYAQFQAFGQVAAARVVEIAPFVGTPQVARDMLAITSAAGFPKLRYWGVSYGTVLGMTFATMFPDNVERLVLDGVVDAVDFYKAEWDHNLNDGDRPLQLFADACSRVGPGKCALYEATGKKVLARIQSIFDSLRTTPIPVVAGNGSADWGIIDYGMVRRTMASWSFVPHATPAQNIALMLAGIEKGDGSFFWKSRFDPRNFLQCTSDPSLQPDSAGAAMLGLAAIGCGDALPVQDTVPALRKWYEGNAQQSSFADVWIFRLVCAGWKVRSAERFKGTVGAATRFPILFVGNTADPASPLINAINMSKRFPKSRVLTIDTPGHTSLATTSTCASQAMRAYFRNGVLPNPGTICASDIQFFEEPMINATASTSARRDDGFARAIAQITRNARIPQFGL